jgi:4-amino-4-deoxy-L-arabinose transferase-like glycosyltransferase
MQRQMQRQLARKLGFATPNPTIDHLWLIFWTILAVLLYTWQLGNLPLRDWDEGIVAVVARGISRSTASQPNWLFPQYFDAPYLNKPPLVHNLIALLYRAFGANEWTTRLPSALLSALSVPLLYALTRELFYPRLPAIFAAGVYLTYLPMLRQGRLAMLDGPIVCFWLLLLVCLLRSRRDLRWSLGIGLSLSLMCLTKGLVGLLLGVIALVFLALDTRRVMRSGYFWGGLLLGAIPLCGWYGAQIWHYGFSFIQVHFFDQALDRVTRSVEQHGQPAWFYGLEILKYGLVWLVFLPFGLKLWWHDRHLSWAKLLGLWIGGYGGLISLMHTKLPWYGMALYPGMAILVGVALAHLWHQNPSISRHVNTQFFPVKLPWLLGLGLFFLAAMGGIIYYPALAIVFCTLTLTLGIAVRLLVKNDRQFMLILIWGMYLTLLGFVSSPHWIWELAEQYDVKPVATLIQATLPRPQAIYTTFPLERPSLEFYADRRIILKPIAALLTQPGDWRALIPNDELPQIPTIQVIATGSNWSIVAPKTPVK